MKIAVSLLCAIVFFQLNTAVQACPMPPTQQNASSTETKVDPAKEKDIRQLLELTGAQDRMNEVLAQMEKNMRPLMEQALPAGDYRQKLVDAFFVKFHSKLDLGKLLDQAVLVYDKHFSHEEIKGLVAFYRTPLGKKYTTELPQLMDEMMIAGQKLGEELGRTSMLEVLAEHPEFQKAIEDAQKNPQP